MKCTKLLAVLMFFIAFVPPAFSQEPEIILNHEEFGKHQRPAVIFPHEAHSTKIDCLRCHHDFDAYSNNRGGEGQQCVNCHDVHPDDGSLSLQEAFHLQCKECHETFRFQGKSAGGTMCGECHIRKK